MRYLVALTLIAALAAPAFAYDYRLPDGDDFYTDTELIAEGPILDDAKPSTVGMSRVPFKWTIWRTMEGSGVGDYTIAYADIFGTDVDLEMNSIDKTAGQNHTIELTGGVDGDPARSCLDAEAVEGDGGHFDNISLEYSLQ